MRPTVCFVPRIRTWCSAGFPRVDRRLVDGADRAALEAQVKAPSCGENVLEGRFIMALTVPRRSPLKMMTAWVGPADRRAFGGGLRLHQARMVLNDGMVRHPR